MEKSENIVSLDNGESILQDLKAYSYNFNRDSNTDVRTHYGFRKVELNRIIPSAIDTMNGDTLINLKEIIPVLVSVIQQQKGRIFLLQTGMDSLSKVISSHEEAITRIFDRCCPDSREDLGNKNNSNVNIKHPLALEPNNENINILYQNVPNPFATSTEIDYYVIPSAFHLSSYNPAKRNCQIESLETIIL
jgi:hypothetical protein